MGRAYAIIFGGGLDSHDIEAYIACSGNSLCMIMLRDKMRGDSIIDVKSTRGALLVVYDPERLYANPWARLARELGKIVVEEMEMNMDPEAAATYIRLADTIGVEGLLSLTNGGGDYVPLVNVEDALRELNERARGRLKLKARRLIRVQLVHGLGLDIDVDATLEYNINVEGDRVNIEVAIPIVMPELLEAMMHSPRRRSIVFEYEGGRVTVTADPERGVIISVDATLQGLTATPDNIFAALKSIVNMGNLASILLALNARSVDEVYSRLPESIAELKPVVREERRR